MLRDRQIVLPGIAGSAAGVILLPLIYVRFPVIDRHTRPDLRGPLCLARRTPVNAATEVAFRRL